MNAELHDLLTGGTGIPVTYKMAKSYASIIFTVIMVSVVLYSVPSSLGSKDPLKLALDLSFPAMFIAFSAYLYRALNRKKNGEIFLAGERLYLHTPPTAYVYFDVKESSFARLSATKLRLKRRIEGAFGVKGDFRMEVYFRNSLDADLIVKRLERIKPLTVAPIRPR